MKSFKKIMDKVASDKIFDQAFKEINEIKENQVKCGEAINASDKEIKELREKIAELEVRIDNFISAGEY